MIVYENENARLLIEDGEINLADKLLSKYMELDSVYITEKTALSLYNMYYKKEIEENPSIKLNNKPCISSCTENENGVITCRNVFLVIYVHQCYSKSVESVLIDQMNT